MSDSAHEQLVERVEKLLATLEGRPDLAPPAGEPPAELVIYFDPPIKGLMGAEHDAISLREPTVKEFDEAEKKAKGKDNAGKELLKILIRLVSGTNDEVVANMPIRKLTEAGDYLQRFF